MLTKAAILGQLAELTKDLYYISDIDGPFTIMDIPPDVKPESIIPFLVSATNQPSNAQLAVGTLTDFFRSQFRQAVAGDTEAQSRATRFR